MIRYGLGSSHYSNYLLSWKSLRVRNFVVQSVWNGWKSMEELKSGRWFGNFERCSFCGNYAYVRAFLSVYLSACIHVCLSVGRLREGKNCERVESSSKGRKYIFANFVFVNSIFGKKGNKAKAITTMEVNASWDFPLKMSTAALFWLLLKVECRFWVRDNFLS